MTGVPGVGIARLRAVSALAWRAGLPKQEKRSWWLLAISSPPVDTYTSFTLDDMGAFFAQPAGSGQSAEQWLGGRKRDFDAIVIGGGTFGCIVAELSLFGRHTQPPLLVLEGGPLCFRAVQNAVHGGCAGSARAVGKSPRAQLYRPDFRGGRPLACSRGWSPECRRRQVAWPPAVRAALRTQYRRSYRQIGVKETNDLYGALHTASQRPRAEVSGQHHWLASQICRPPAVAIMTQESPLTAAVLRDG